MSSLRAHLWFLKKVLLRWSTRHFWSRRRYETLSMTAFFIKITQKSIASWQRWSDLASPCLFKNIAATLSERTYMVQPLICWRETQYARWITHLNCSLFIVWTFMWRESSWSDLGPWLLRSPEWAHHCMDQASVIRVMESRVREKGNPLHTEVGSIYQSKDYNTLADTWVNMSSAWRDGW